MSAKVIQAACVRQRTEDEYADTRSDSRASSSSTTTDAPPVQSCRAGISSTWDRESGLFSTQHQGILFSNSPTEFWREILNFFVHFVPELT